MKHTPALQFAEDAIDLFLEFRDSHGYPEDRAKAAALLEVQEAAHLAPSARLIEAAPLLLEACKMAHTAFTAITDHDDYGFDAEIAQLQAAITAATEEE